MFALPTHIFYPCSLSLFPATSPEGMPIFSMFVDNALIKCESGTASPDLMLLQAKNDGSSSLIVCLVGIGTYHFGALRGVVGTFKLHFSPNWISFDQFTSAAFFYSPFRWLHCSKPYLHQTLKCRSVASNPVMLAQIFNWQGFFVCFDFALKLIHRYVKESLLAAFATVVLIFWSLCYLWW